MKTGKNFDDSDAKDIFDRLKNVEGKVKPKRKGRFDNITHLMQEAQNLEKNNDYTEAVKLYNEVLFTLPDSKKAYEGLIGIYQKTGDTESEKDILRKAVSNCKDNEKFKIRLGELQ